MKPFTNKRPAKSSGFTYSRMVSMDGALVTYRLFRRDHRNKLHQVERQFLTKVAPRSMIAGDLLQARRVLRDRVDTIDLRAMGEAA